VPYKYTCHQGRHCNNHCGDRRAPSQHHSGHTRHRYSRVIGLDKGRSTNNASNAGTTGTGTGTGTDTDTGTGGGSGGSNFYAGAGANLSCRNTGANLSSCG